MNKKNITPNPSQPVDRVPTGKLPAALAELSEEAIGGVTASVGFHTINSFSIHVTTAYDGDDE